MPSEANEMVMYDSGFSTDGPSLLYQSNQVNHPACSRLTLGSSNSSAGDISKASNLVLRPQPPEKPLIPYLRYCKKIWEIIKVKKPDLELWQLGTMISQMWKDLSPNDKQIFVEEYDKEKIDYLDQLRSYHNSPAYQIYLQQEDRLKETERDHAIRKEDALNQSLESIAFKADKEFSVLKDNAAARFLCNHYLMKCILVDSFVVVPTESAVVTNEKILVLRNQVQSLSDNYIQLQQDMLEIENQHNATKQKWVQGRKK